MNLPVGSGAQELKRIFFPPSSRMNELVTLRVDTSITSMPFFSMVDRRKSLHHDIIASTRELFPRLLATEVPYSSEIERMSVRRAPLPAYSPRSPVGQLYAALWTEIEGRMKLAPPARAPLEEVVV